MAEGPGRTVADETAKPNDDGEGEAEKEEGESQIGGEHCALLLEQINHVVRGDMMSMGFGKIRTEKALYYTGGQSQDFALSWLEEHQDEEGLDIPIPAQDVKPKLTPEEASVKALELQRHARGRRTEIEKSEEREREKSRIETGKKLLDANRILEEQTRSREIEGLKREKTVHDTEAQRLKDALRIEHHERFGPDVPFPGDIKEATDASNVKQKSEKEQVIYWVNSLSKEYKTTNPSGLLCCLNTLTAYITNAKDHPTEPKYHKIAKKNKAFQERVAGYTGATELMKVVGFKDTGDQLEITETADGFTMLQAIKFIEVLRRQL